MKRVKGVFKTAAVILMCLALVGCGVSTPLDSQDCKGMNPDELAQKMKDAGFNNVKFEDKETVDPEQVDTVAGITISGNFSFSERQRFNKDDEVIIRKYTMEQNEVTVDVDTTGEQGKPEFNVFMGLPKGTIATLTLENDKGYSQTEEVTLDKDGKGKSHRFTQPPADTYLAGEYKLTVSMMPHKQPSKVTKAIGEKGESLTGAAVQTDDSTGEKYVIYEMDYKSPFSQEEFDEATAQKPWDKVVNLVKQDVQSAFSDSNMYYKVEQEANGITITLWGDGVSEIAVAAKLGDRSSKKTWKKLTKRVLKASIECQINYLNANGYDDKKVLINLANEKDTEKVLYQALSGEVVYDYLDD